MEIIVGFYDLYSSYFITVVQIRKTVQDTIASVNFINENFIL